MLEHVNIDYVSVIIFVSTEADSLCSAKMLSVSFLNYAEIFEKWEYSVSNVSCRDLHLIGVKNRIIKTVWGCKVMDVYKLWRLYWLDIKMVYSSNKRVTIIEESNSVWCQQAH